MGHHSTGSNVNENDFGGVFKLLFLYHTDSDVKEWAIFLYIIVTWKCFIQNLYVLFEGVGGYQTVEGTRRSIAKDTASTDATETFCTRSVTRYLLAVKSRSFCLIDFQRCCNPHICVNQHVAVCSVCCFVLSGDGLAYPLGCCVCLWRSFIVAKYLNSEGNHRASLLCIECGLDLSLERESPPQVGCWT